MIDAILLAASGTVGAVIGLGLALYATHKRELPQATAPSAMKHLNDATRERAQLAAERKALTTAFKAGKVDDHTYVAKDTELLHRIDRLDKEINAALKHLSKESLPQEMLAAEARVREAGDITTLSQRIVELQQQLGEAEHERHELHLALGEAEADKKRSLAEKNALQRKFVREGTEVDELKKSIEELKGHKAELEKRASRGGPGDLRLGTLRDENARLRASLEKVRAKAKTAEQTLGVLETVVGHHAKDIEELRSPEELKALIQPKNPSIADLARKHANPKAAYEFVRDEIVEVYPPLSTSYWLEPSEVLRLRAGDQEDRAVVLCSLLRALGEEARVISVELKNGLIRSLVLLGDTLLDPKETGEFNDFSGLSREEALRKYEFDGSGVKRVVREFNDVSYKSH